MGFKDWLIQKFAPPKNVTVEELIKDEDVQQAVNELYLKELAFWTCVNKIANALSKCEFKTYYKNAEKRKGMVSMECRTKSKPECDGIY